ncbi:MAG: class I SAM-dependent rRNA methyltransferase [Kofleriaceae bacterium]|nr:class I SAM-dependent rRNA methyltransferase [Kofleriaceae bacterium]MCB9571105.1 class I SAM-dependent rRNA methyltransferase [Kofleriaceae bacterium]
MTRAIPLAGDAAAALRDGVRDLDATRVPLPDGAAPPGPGEPVLLVDAGGNELGCGLADPENGLYRVYAIAADRFVGVDAALIGWRVERAVALRRWLGLPGERAAYRLIHGAGDGLPGLTCDVLGDWAVIWAYGHGLVPVARTLAEAVRGFARVRGVVIKVRARGGAGAGGALTQEVVGDAPPDAHVAEEHGVPFEIHALGGLNTGLFTDMREQRRGLGRFVDGRGVLNLFSYTGALSVAAARAGASRVTSVDTSAGVQQWARGNFGRAGLDPGDRRWRFEVGDAVRFLTRAAKERERYDVVLIDPPTFSPARGTPWALDKDYPDLIARAAAVIPDGGVLWLAANTHELGSLGKLAAKGLRKAGRTSAVLEQAGLPPCHPTAAAQPRDRYLQIVVLRLT